MVLTTENNSEKVYIPKYKELKAVLEELQSPDILSKVSNEEFLKYCKPTYVNGFRNEFNLERFGVFTLSTKDSASCIDRQSCGSVVLKKSTMI